MSGSCPFPSPTTLPPYGHIIVTIIVDGSDSVHRFVAAAIVAIFGISAGAEEADLASLRFLLGEWEAVGTPAGETGGFTFALGVQNQVLTRTNYAIYEARDGRPASHHDDLMVIYRERDQLRADYFDSEQHVIRYVVQPKGDREVMFTSEPTGNEPRYRLTYVARADGTLAGRFEIAAPVRPNSDYLSWSARKVR